MGMNNLLTIVIPGLSSQEAVDLKSELKKVKKTVAPNARGSIVIGKREEFISLMDSCWKKIGGKN